MMIDRVINPRLSAELTDLLETYEVPEEEGALLWELEKRRYWVYLTGPDESRSVGFRWEARIVNTETGGNGKITRGQTARIALALAFKHVVQSLPPGPDNNVTRTPYPVAAKEVE